ncbi:MAG: hypothetical protein ACREVY_13815 [Gammaproteobacteria bacterium]
MNTEADLEATVCGFLREPVAFWSFRRAAGAPDAKRLRSIHTTAARPGLNPKP